MNKDCSHGRLRPSSSTSFFPFEVDQNKEIAGNHVILASFHGNDTSKPSKQPFIFLCDITIFEGDIKEHE